MITSFSIQLNIWDTLRDLVPFVQLKKCEKGPSWSESFNKVPDFILQLY